jgi:hypothetical protein
MTVSSPSADRSRPATRRRRRDPQHSAARTPTSSPDRTQSHLRRGMTRSGSTRFTQLAGRGLGGNDQAPGGWRSGSRRADSQTRCGRCRQSRAPKRAKISHQGAWVDAARSGCWRSSVVHDVEANFWPRTVAAARWRCSAELVGVSQRRACRVAGQHRSTQRLDRPHRRSEDEEHLGAWLRRATVAGPACR